MATRSLIGTVYDDGSIIGIYCHWDGYPSAKLKELASHFGKYSQALSLIALGDISALWTDKGWDGKQRPEGPLTYAERGENCPPKQYANIQEFINAADQKYGAEHCYVFKPSVSKWEHYDVAELAQTPLQMAADNLYSLLNGNAYKYFAQHYGAWFENHGIDAIKAAELAENAAKRQIRRLTMLVNTAEFEEVAEDILAEHCSN